MKKNQPLVSVIITVYNLEAYIYRCLTSIINQTYLRLEVIIINDGSTDNSEKIIQAFIKRDSRFRLINTINEGVNSARKKGIQFAKGDYIHHLDGDDYLNPTAYTTWVNQAILTNADLLLLDFWVENNATGKKKSSMPYSQKSYNNIEFLNLILCRHGYFALWAYLHKRSLYDNPILFSNQISFGEDALITSQIVYYSTNIVSMSMTPLLHYVFHNDSVSNSMFSEKRKLDLINFPDAIMNFMKTKKEFEEVRVSIAYLKIQCLNIIINQSYQKNIRLISKLAIQIFQEHPELKLINNIKYHYNLYNMWNKSILLGFIYGRYLNNKNIINI